MHLFIYSFIHSFTCSLTNVSRVTVHDPVPVNNTHSVNYTHATCTTKRLAVLCKHVKGETKDRTRRTDGASASESDSRRLQPRGVAKGRQRQVSSNLGGSANLAALILGLPASTKCMATSFYVSEDSKEIKHAVDNSENFTQANGGRERRKAATRRRNTCQPQTVRDPKFKKTLACRNTILIYKLRLLK